MKKSPLNDSISEKYLEEVENVEEKTVTGNGTITFENLEPLEHEIYLIKQINFISWRSLKTKDDSAKFCKPRLTECDDFFWDSADKLPHI